MVLLFLIFSKIQIPHPSIRKVISPIPHDGVLKQKKYRSHRNTVMDLVGLGIIWKAMKTCAQDKSSSWISIQAPVMQVEVEANFWPGSLAVKAFYFLFHVINIIYYYYYYHLCLSKKNLVQNDNLNYRKGEFLTHTTQLWCYGGFPLS